MTHEIVRFGNNAAERRSTREVAAVTAAVDLVRTKMMALSYTGQAAISEVTLLQAAQKAAEEIFPNGSEAYAQVVQVATQQIVMQLIGLGYRLDRI